MFKRVRDVSEKVGHYSVLRGYKEYGMSLPTSDLTTGDSQMEDLSDLQEGDAAGNAANQPIMSKDLVSMA